MTTKYNIGDEIIYYNTDTGTEMVMVIDYITITKNCPEYICYSDKYGEHVCTEDNIRKIFEEKDLKNFGVF